MESPQAGAMGGASLANPADSATLFLNPALSARLSAGEAYFMYDQLYAGLSGAGGIGQSFAAVAAPTPFGVLSAGYGEFSAAGLLNERVVGVAFSRRLFGAIDAGVTGKYLAEQYSIGSDPLAANDPVFKNGTSRSAFSVDAGLAARVSDSLELSLAVRNLNEPNVGLASVDRVPRAIQAGLAYDFKPQGLRLTADFINRDVPAGTFQDRNQPSVGLEKSVANGIVKFRIGANLEQFSGGLGIQLGRITFDYAFILARTLAANNDGTHQVGFRYRFGGPNPSRGH